MRLFIVIILVAFVTLTKGVYRFSKFSSEIKVRESDDDDIAGEPVILTPYIQDNRIEEAQALSKVDNSVFDFLNVSSYSGYFTVDSNFNSSLFFWFFPAFEDYENAPLLLWLQGGPGSPSIRGLFKENGPFVLKGNSQIAIRETTWTKSHSVIYIDNPVGTGYSFTDGGYAQNQTKVGEHLYEALQQFFTLFPNLRDKKFFITGESYAGKYIPALGHTILHRNPYNENKINLQGLCIGNGVSDPEHQLILADRLYELGLMDSKTRDTLLFYEAQAAQFMREGKYDEANGVFDIMINGADSIFEKATALINVYNFLIADNKEGAILDGYLSELTENEWFRKSIHVGYVPFNDAFVYDNLHQDIPKSVAPWVSELLDNYRVLIYNGQLDLLVPYPATTVFLQTLNFSSAEEYKVADRHLWYVGDDLAGYVKTAGNLTEVLVRNAGHMVPADQPFWMLDLLTKFIRNETIYNK